MLKMTFTAVFAATSTLGLFVASAKAAELVMVEVRSCVYCARFNSEMAEIYESSETGRAIPLRRVHPRKWPADLAAVEKTPFTPVFILVDQGSEIGRFAGYNGPEHFTSKLEQLLGR